MSEQYMINENGAWQGDSNDIWQQAIPLPLKRSFIFPKPFRCVLCAEKFYSERHYELHYIHNHTDGKIYRRTSKGMVEIKGKS